MRTMSPRQNDDGTWSVVVLYEKDGVTQSWVFVLRNNGNVTRSQGPGPLECGGLCSEARMAAVSTFAQNSCQASEVKEAGPKVTMLTGYRKPVNEGPAPSRATAIFEK